MEDSAKSASASFPIVMSEIFKITPDEVFQKSSSMKDRLQADLRIVQGIAYPLVVTERVSYSINNDSHYY